MKLFEITAEYHDTLNPKLWDDMTLKKEVADKLKKIADEFIEFLDVKKLKAEDIIITGSNANYNWTELSDIDLHVLVSMKKLRDICPDLLEDFFQDKKTIWNEHHDITIYGHDVELYVQDADEKHVASGVYSLKNGQWIKEPKYNKPSIDDSAVMAKADQFKYEISKLIDAEAGNEAVQDMKEKIRNLRQTGLREKGTEWSTENLAFKELRNTGYLKKLSDYAKQKKGEKLSLE